MKKIIAAALLLTLVFTLSTTAFAAEPRSDVLTMEFNTTYQGTNAGYNAGAAYGPDQYLLYCPTAKYVTFTVIHNDPIGNANGPSGEAVWGDGGFYLSIDNAQTGGYVCLSYVSQYTLYLPIGYHLISIGSQRYAESSATYTIKAA